MINKLKHFPYSQNSINTYKSCPMKFKYKYIDKINWKHDDIESRDYYENLKLGRDFHLICERYFSNIPLGIYGNNEEKFNKWIEKIKKLIPIEDDNIYLPEYEVRINLDGKTIQAKYDLIVVEENNIEIWDWKTENKKINYKNVENRLQTIVYMFLAQEVIPKILNKNIKCENIKMKYYQPEFDSEAIVIPYSENKHKMNKENISNYINIIERTNYGERDNENFTELIKNKNHCKFCEFNKLCNGQDVNYSILEEEDYGA